MAGENIHIKNRKAYHNYEITDKWVAGLKLTGTEVKSLRNGKASIGEGYCHFKGGELWVKNVHIAEYTQGNIYNHEPTRERKLLLQKRELKRLHDAVREKGMSIVPLRIFFNDRGFAKLEIGLARGKKLYDKRESLKEKSAKREIERQLKI